jgi:small subunit ribosomal protein S6e
MVEFKVVIGDQKAKLTYQTIVKDNDADKLIGKTIGETIRGELLGIPGYELQITGGSDKQGFPMKKNIEGAKKIRILLTKGVGYCPNRKRKGLMQKRTITGNTIHDGTAQINTKIIKYGTEDLKTKFAKAEKKAEDKQ